MESQEVLVSIKSAINGEITETLSNGTIGTRDGVLTIDFEEKNEEINTPLICQIKLLEKGVFLSKKGEFEIEALFDLGVETTFTCTTPFGEMTFDLETKKIEINQDTLPEIYIEYMLKDGEDEISFCKVRIQLKEI